MRWWPLPCPTWCNDTTGHTDWEDDGPDGYWRTHTRTIGPFTVVAVERIHADGTIGMGNASIESHPDDIDTAEQARRRAADLLEAARVMDKIGEQ